MKKYNIKILDKEKLNVVEAGSLDNVKRKLKYIHKRISTSNSAITLIALIVTIIVLLILAGVALNMVIGESGIFKKANIAQENTKKQQVIEELKIKVLEVQTQKNGKAKLKDVEEYFKSSNENIEIISEIDDNSNEMKVKYNGYEFIIDNKLIVAFLDDKSEADNNELTELQKALKAAGVDTSLTEEEIKENKNGTLEKMLENEIAVKYIMNNPEKYMEVIYTDLNFSTKLLKNEENVNNLIKNDTWRNRILQSTIDKEGNGSVIITALDNSNPKTVDIQTLGIYDENNPNGNVLYSSWLRKDPKHSPINAFVGSKPGVNDWETEANAIPAYIGYDFGENNSTWIYRAYVKGGNNTTPTKMYLQSSDDNITWNTIYEFKRYTGVNDYITELINSENNNKRYRYWRLYITESSGSNYIDLLKFELYGK